MAKTSLLLRRRTDNEPVDSLDLSTNCCSNSRCRHNRNTVALSGITSSSPICGLESCTDGRFVDADKSPNVEDDADDDKGSKGFNSDVGRALRSDGNILKLGEVSSDVIIQSALLLLGDGFHSESRAGVIPKSEDGREGRADPPRGGGCSRTGGGGGRKRGSVKTPSSGGREEKSVSDSRKPNPAILPPPPLPLRVPLVPLQRLSASKSALD